MHKVLTWWILWTLRDWHDISLKACNLCGKYLWKAWNFYMHKREAQWLFFGDWQMTNMTACSQAGHLRKHLKIHSRENLNKCTQCDFAFSHAGHSSTHLKMYSGWKPNKCSQCDYASSVTGNLRRHLKTHNRDKSNKCNQCDCACNNASNLRRHMKAHRGERSIKCKQCDFTSSQASQKRKAKYMQPVWLCMLWCI